MQTQFFFRTLCQKKKILLDISLYIYRKPRHVDPEFNLINFIAKRCILISLLVSLMMLHFPILNNLKFCSLSYVYICLVGFI